MKRNWLLKLRLTQKIKNFKVRVCKNRSLFRKRLIWDSILAVPHIFSLISHFWASESNWARLTWDFTFPVALSKKCFLVLFSTFETSQKILWKNPFGTAILENFYTLIGWSAMVARRPLSTLSRWTKLSAYNNLGILFFQYR